VILFADSEIRRACERLVSLFQLLGGTVLFVGGCVRDALLGIPASDIDIEVFGLSVAVIEEAVRKEFDFDCVGKAFGILKLKHLPIDISIPRYETKLGLGHRGFQIESNPYLSVTEALSRRDFTINALAWDPIDCKLMDPFGGKVDLKNKLLKHTSHKFIEDPLRVLRCMQFMGRFELQIDPTTLALCQTIIPENLSPERIWHEWKKWLLKSKKPALGLNFLKASGWIIYYPELQHLLNFTATVHASSKTLWECTLAALDNFATRQLSEKIDPTVIGLAILCYGLKDHHAQINFLKRTGTPIKLIPKIVRFIRYASKPIEFIETDATDEAFRRLALEVSLDGLSYITHCLLTASFFSKTNSDSITKRFREKAKALSIYQTPPQPIILGRHLIEIGCNPGPNFSNILKACFEAQLQGVFVDLATGKVFLKSLFEKFI
jgi:tRNA nucleotidyltransferase (CCA-adding enzyme)